jgi:hypothetical protein
MVTFTLPYELRSLVWRHQKDVYSILFACVSSTLKDFGLNPKNLGAEIGMTMVLHTNNRKRDYHPHVHVVVPGGGVDKRRRQWKKKKGKYLFNKEALAKVFRARFLEALSEAGFSIPKRVPEKWVADCRRVGKGITALKYLSRYLYRGVISEKNIVSNQNGQVTFKYTERKTGNTLYRTLKGEDFLHLILQHVLPKGFRRVRDYYSVPEVLHTLLTIYNPQVRHHNEPIFEAILLQYQQHIVLIRVPCGSQFHEI